VLAEQVGTELYFAGEATHNTAMASVIGAMRSGERAAGEIHSDTGGPPSVMAPTANFSADVTSGSAPLNVTFADSSVRSATSWSWDFGDTGTSSDQHPVHPYTTPGSYTVSLTATNASGSHTLVQPVLITVPEPSVAAGLGCGAFFLTLLNARRNRTRSAAVQRRSL
jgi:PKD repeat protein